MTHRSDARFAALRGQGFLGATSDMIQQWLVNNGATKGATPDMWREMLTAQGFNTGDRNQDWYDLLDSLGYTDPDINQRELDFWEAGGVIGPYDGVTITIQPQNWTGNVGDPATFTVTATSGNASPLTYEWQEFITGAWTPTVDGGTLSGSNTDTLTINPTAATDDQRRFRCRVCNSFNCRDSNAAILDTIYVAPTVDAGGPYSGAVSTAINLNATVTPGSDPAPVYLWTIDSGGTGTFSDDSIEDPTFTPDSVGAYVLRLTVTPVDGAAAFDTANLDSQAAVVAPTVDAGGPYSGTVNTPIAIDGTVTPGSDPAPTILWTEPSALGGTFADASAVDTTFTPTQVSAAYSLQLSADPSDGPPVTDTATLNSQSGAVSAIFSVKLQNSLIPEVATGDGTPTFTRTSTATVVDFEGIVRTVQAGEARFQGARRVENLHTHSQEFDNAAWNKGNTSITANATAAPDSTNTADKLIASASSAFHALEQTANFQDTVIYSFSIYAKAAEYSYLQILAGGVGFDPGSNEYQNFNLTTGTLGNTDSAGNDIINAAIENVGNGWYRCSVASRAISSSGRFILSVMDQDYDQRAPSYLGDGTSGIYVWGVQLAEGTNPQEYVSTNVLSAPYHGANVDGVEYFTTDRAGNPIDQTDFYADADGPFGYLAEGSSTNELTYSEQFDNTIWSKVSSAVNADATASPDGATTADRLLDDNTGGSGVVYVHNDFTLPAGGSQIFSVFAKRDGLNWIRLAAGGFDVQPDIYFDLLNGAVGSTPSNVDDSGIDALGNDWYRCWFVFTTTTDLIGDFRIYPATGDNNSVVTKDGTSSVFVWGAMAENKAFPTSYIKTEASAASRTADLLTYADLSNIADAAGTVKADASTLWTAAAAKSVAVGRTAIGILHSAAADQDNVIKAEDGTTVATSATGLDMLNAPQDVKASWGANLTASFNAVDGVQVAYDNTIGAGAIGVGGYNVAGAEWYGTVRNVEIYDQEGVT